MKIKVLFLVFLLLIGCNRPLTKDEEALLAVVGLITVGYLVYQEAKEGGGGNGGGAYSNDPPPCPRGYYQGCCSHHGGIWGCENFRVVCNDGTISPTCSCPSSYCVFQ
jgi:hypothetical protein